MNDETWFSWFDTDDDGAAAEDDDDCWAQAFERILIEFSLFSS